MSEHELEPLPSDVLAHLAQAKSIPRVDEDRRAAIAAATFAAIGGGGGGGGGAPAKAALGTKAIAALLGTFALGAIVGITLDRSLTPPPVAAPVVTVIARAPDTIAKPVASDAVPASSLPDAPRAAATVVTEAPSAPAAPSARGLAAERALLDVARSALARGEAGDALAAADRHAREYPEGALAEERDAIAIRALAALGRRPEAKTRAAAFERRYPKSLALGAIHALGLEN
jgi:hypothetical protein